MFFFFKSKIISIFIFRFLQIAELEAEIDSLRSKLLKQMKNKVIALDDEDDGDDADEEDTEEDSFNSMIETQIE